MQKSKLFFFILLFFLFGCNETKNDLFVRFYDYDGFIVELTVTSEDLIEAPEPRLKEGHTFIGWDQELTNIQESLSVKALYERNIYTINFYSADNKIISTKEVLFGDDAPLPEAPYLEGHTFIGWDQELTNIQESLSVYPFFEINSYTIKWVNTDGEVLYVIENINHGETFKYDGEEPVKKETTQYRYEFIGWSSTNNIAIEDQTFVAQFEQIQLLSVNLYINNDFFISYKVDKGEKFSEPLHLMQYFEYTYISWHTTPLMQNNHQFDFSRTIDEDVNIFGKTWYIPYTFINHGKSNLTWEPGYYFNIGMNSILNVRVKYYEFLYFFVYAEQGQRVVVATQTSYLRMPDSVLLSVAGDKGEILNGGRAINIKRTIDDLNQLVLEFEVTQTGIYYIAVVSTLDHLKDFYYIFDITADVLD